LSNASLALGCGIEKLEISHNASRKSKKKASLAAGILKKLGGKFKEGGSDVRWARS
jgi:hypothetical protein